MLVRIWSHHGMLRMGNMKPERIIVGSIEKSDAS